MLLLGAGVVSIGLTPPLLSSVAPSGIVPPLSVVDVVPGVDKGEAVPVGETAAGDMQPDVDVLYPPAPVDPVVPMGPIELIDPAAASPLPSKVELVLMLDVPAPAVPASPEYAEPGAAQFDAPGVLKPPGLISVAPSGTPLGLFPVVE